MDIDEAIGAVMTLSVDLGKLAQRDPDQEVSGMALPVLDTVLGGVKSHLPAGHPVLSRMHDLISPESVEAGVPVLASEMYLVARQLLNALQSARPRRPSGWDYQLGRSSA